VGRSFITFAILVTHQKASPTIMPPPVANKSKVQKRKTEMGHGSTHGDKADGYGKSPVVVKPKLASVPGLAPSRNLSPARAGPKTRASLEHPKSAPARDRRTAGSLPNGVSLAPMPDLDGDASFNISSIKVPKKKKKRSDDPAQRLSASMPAIRTPETPSKQRFNASVPSGFIFAPNLDMDSSDDRSYRSNDSSMHTSGALNSSILLESIPEKKKKKKEKTLSPTSSAASGSQVYPKKHAPRSSSMGSPPSSPGKTKHTPRSSSMGSPPSSPGKNKARLSQSPGPRKGSKSPGPNYRGPKRTSSKSPGPNHRRSASDAGGAAGSRKSKMIASKGDSIMSLDGPSGKRPKSKSMPQPPLTWHDNRDSRKLNSSNIGKKIGGLATIPALDDDSAHGSRISRSSKSNHNSRLRGSSHSPMRSSARSSHASMRSSSHAPRQSQAGSQRPRPSHVPRTSAAAGLNNEKMSRSTHSMSRSSTHSTSRSERSGGNKAPIPRGESISKNSTRSSTRKSGLVGSVMGVVDKVLERTVQVSSDKYGVDKAVNAEIEDSDTDSFANEADIEAEQGKKKSSFKQKSGKTGKLTAVKDKLNQKKSKALEFMGTSLGIENKPPKTLVIVWILIVSELIFDFVTTVISFKAFSQGQTCCGYEVNLGRVPVAITVPFFFLVLAESTFLFIAITLTLWPSILNDGEESEPTTMKRWLKPFLCCFKWNSTAVLYALNITVILNPFFGCVIAWMLLYQSDKFESFLVLGLEGGSIILHFTSVWLDGSCKRCRDFCFHSVQLLPFLTSVTLILLYLRQGGVCYLVDEENFVFTGCEVCPGGWAPVGGICQLEDGTNITVTTKRLWEVEGDFSDLADALTARTPQGRYCSADHPEGPEVDFCFFTY
jgi:hypothetical protein